MPERRTLILTTHHLVACQWRHGEVREEQVFNVDEEGQGQFRSYLEQHHATLFHLLVDLPDEVFHQEALPHVVGKDRQALLTRKLNQHFFGTPYTLARSLGREKQGRRDELFSFAALTRPQALEPWLHIMQDAGIALVGIYAPSLLLTEMLDKAAAAEPRLILITLGSGGLRQSYFEQGLLRFSRLKPLTTCNIEEAAVNTFGEAVRIHQYLIGQRLLTRGQKVPVLCLANPAHFELLHQACADTDELRFRFSDLQTVAHNSHLHTPLTDSIVDPLLVHLLARHAPSLQFGNAESRQNYRRWQWRSAINIGSLGLLGIAALFALGAGVSVYLSQIRTADAQLAAQSEQRKYESLVKSLPAIGVSPQELRSLIGDWHQLKARSPDLATTLQPLSLALQLNAQIELQDLDWRLGNNPDDSRSDYSRPAAADAYVIMDIVAQLPSSLGADRRMQSEIVERFVNALKRSPDDNARVLQRPFDTDSAKSLKGSSESYGRNEPLTFTVRYWRKIET